MIQVMEDYDLTKEDWDSIIEVGQFEGQKDPVAAIPSKVCVLLSLELGPVTRSLKAHQQ